MERPILFSAPMVRAILEGRKTMTRRVITTVKLNGRFRKIRELKITDTPGYDYIMRDGPGGCWNDLRKSEMVERSPFGVPGDRLWVREMSVRFTGCASQGKPWGEVPFSLSPDGDPYKALLPIVGNEKHVANLNYAAACVTVPSIFMPHWASRILLEVTDVRVERVQDIDDTDAEREGCDGADMVPGYSRNQFAKLWDSINAKRGYGWDANPWVWVVSFKPAPDAGDATKEKE